jgi:hypothetical protein
MVVGLVSLFAVPAASASPLVGARNAVGVIGVAAGQRVGFHEAVPAGQGRIRAPGYDQTVVGSCVAPETAGTDAAETAGGGGRTFVTTPRGTTFDIPEGYVGREADNGAGIVFQEPGAPGNAGSIRIMEPTAQYPDGYFRYYNSEGNGQALDVNGKPGPPSTTHIPENYIGPVLEWPGG